VRPSPPPSSSSSTQAADSCLDAATFLNVLAGRVGNLELPTGEIAYSAATGAAGSRSSSLSAAKKAIGYVRQDDALLPYLTVAETLETAAALRLPESVSPQQRAAIVQQTMAELGLRDVADVLVGGALRRGISGGERRRLTIGCQLVTLPSILLLDEPTSGLDSSTAFQILQTLQRLAANGRVVVLSCHLPRSEAFTLVRLVSPPPRRARASLTQRPPPAVRQGPPPLSRFARLLWAARAHAPSFRLARVRASAAHQPSRLRHRREHSLHSIPSSSCPSSTH